MMLPCESQCNTNIGTGCFFLQIVPDVRSTQALHVFRLCNIPNSRSWWPHGLRCGSAAARLMWLWVRIPWVARMSVCCECCVGRGTCVGLITCTEESYRMWCVWVWSWSLDKEEALAHETLSKLISNCHSYKVEVTFAYFGLLECDAV